MNFNLRQPLVEENRASELEAELMPKSLCGGVCVNLILVFRLSLGQAEQYLNFLETISLGIII